MWNQNNEMGRGTVSTRLFPNILTLQSFDLQKQEVLRTLGGSGALELHKAAGQSPDLLRIFIQSDEDPVRDRARTFSA